jgi:hypothetical protein
MVLLSNEIILSTTMAGGRWGRRISTGGKLFKIVTFIKKYLKEKIIYGWGRYPHRRS